MYGKQKCVRPFAAGLPQTLDGGAVWDGPLVRRRVYRYAARTLQLHLYGQHSTKP